MFGSLRIRPIVTVEDDGSFAFSFAAGHSAADVDDTLERLLRMLGETAASRKRRSVSGFNAASMRAPSATVPFADSRHVPSASVQVVTDRRR